MELRVRITRKGELYRRSEGLKPRNSGILVKRSALILQPAWEERNLISDSRIKVVFRMHSNGHSEVLSGFDGIQHEGG